MDTFIGIDGEQEGPLPEAEIRQRIAAGRLQAHHLCWQDGWPDWKPVREAFPEAFAPVRAAVPAAPPAVAPPLPGGAAPMSGAAVASLVLGVSGMLLSVAAAIPAIVCGHIALVSIRRSAGRMTGNGLAIAGLALGYAWTALALLIVPAIAIPAFVAARDAARFGLSVQNLLQISSAAQMYAFDHKDTWPSAPADLVASGLVGSAVMDLPYTDEVESAGYAFVPCCTASMPGDTVFAYESVPRPDGSVAVARLDGTVDVLPFGSPELEKLSLGR
jgi:hypothetical protein